MRMNQSTDFIGAEQIFVVYIKTRYFNINLLEY